MMGQLAFSLGIGDPDSSRQSVDVSVNILEVKGRARGKSFGDRVPSTSKFISGLLRSAALLWDSENFGNWGGTDAPQSLYAVYSFRTGLRDGGRSTKPFSNLYASLSVWEMGGFCRGSLKRWAGEASTFLAA